jgi:DNA-binding transcriptional regulator YdaS (Cro superfamily)
VRGAIDRAGGRTVVARALGVSSPTVRSWDVGKCSPAGDRLQRLVSLPDGLPLRPGPPRRARLADPAIFEEAVSVAGSVSAAARELGLERRTVQRYLRREREVPADVLEHAREFLAANGVTSAPEEQPPS